MELEIKFDEFKEIIEKTSDNNIREIIERNLPIIKRMIDEFNAIHNIFDLAFDQLKAIQAFIANVLSEIDREDVGSQVKENGKWIFQRIGKICEEHSERLTNQSKLHQNEKQELEWKEDHLRYSQQFLVEQPELKEQMVRTLALIANRAKDKGYRFPNQVFISYAWPTDENEEKKDLGWVQPFLVELRNHLQRAGIATTSLDLKDSNDNAHRFMDNVTTADYVVLVGTESLLLKHRRGTSLVCSELVNIARKREEDARLGKNRFIGILLSGSIETSFPPQYQGYTIIEYWNNGIPYLTHLQGLLKKLYNVPETAFTDIWEDFFGKVPGHRLVLERGFSKEAVLVHHNNEKAEEEKRKAQLRQSSLVSLSLLSPRQPAAAPLQEIKLKPALKESKANLLKWKEGHQVQYFTGRETKLAEIKTQLEQKQIGVITQVIVGMGGIGKTQLCLAYAQRSYQEYEGRVYWIDAETELSLMKSLRELVRVLVSNEINTDILSDDGVLEIIFRKLDASPKSLLIFDNAEEEALVCRYLPRLGQHHVLISTRHSHWTTGHYIFLDNFTEEEAVEFILKVLNTHYQGQETVNAARELARTLAYFPLALGQAVHTIGNKSTIELYLRQYNESYDKRKKLLGTSSILPDIYKLTVLTTWSLSRDKLREISPESEEVLKLSAYLNPDGILKAIFPFFMRVKRNAINCLAEHSLIQIIDGNAPRDSFKIHRLFQEVIRLELADKKDVEGELITKFINCFSEILMTNDSSIPVPRSIKPYILHIEALAGHATRINLQSEELIGLLIKVGYYYLIHERSNHLAAQKFQLVLMMIDLIKNSSAEHSFELLLFEADAKSGYAYSLLAKGQISNARALSDEARQMYNGFLFALKKVDYEVNYGNVFSLITIGYTHFVEHERANTPEKAEECLLKARDYFDKAKVLGERVGKVSRWDVARANHALGSTYYFLGKYAAERRQLSDAKKHYQLSEKMFNNAILMRMKVYKTREHVEIARSRDQRGTALMALGRKEEARKEFEEALRIQRKLLPEQHPDIRETLDHIQNNQLQMRSCRFWKVSIAATAILSAGAAIAVQHYNNSPNCKIM